MITSSVRETGSLCPCFCSSNGLKEHLAFQSIWFTKMLVRRDTTSVISNHYDLEGKGSPSRVLRDSTWVRGDMDVHARHFCEAATLLFTLASTKSFHCKPVPKVCVKRYWCVPSFSWHEKRSKDIWWQTWTPVLGMSQRSLSCSDHSTESNYFHDFWVLERVKQKCTWKEVIWDKMTWIGHVALYGKLLSHSRPLFAQLQWRIPLLAELVWEV